MKSFALSCAVLATLLCATSAFAQAAPPAAPAAAPASAPGEPEAPPPTAEAAVPPAAPAPAAAAPGAAPPVAPPAVFVAPPPAPPAAPAAAPEPADASPSDEPEPFDDGTLGRHQQHLLLGIGVRTTFVSDAGFDPFSETDALPQVTLDAGAVLWTNEEVSLAGLAGWDYGGSSSTARGAKTSLDVHRWWLAAEVRYHLLRRLYGFGRVAPALLESSASLKDGAANVERKADAWVFGADVSLGAAYEIAGQRNGAVRSPRGWLGIEGGYSWAASSVLVLDVDADDDTAPSRTASLDLGELALRGPFVRANLALTF